MKSGLPPAARAIRSRSSAETPSPISASACSGGSGSSRSVPGQPGRRSTSSGRAMHRSSSGAPAESSAVDSIRSRNVSSPHWMSSKTTTSGACSSSSFRNAQAISSPLVPTSDSPSSERIAAAATGSRRQHGELLHHLDDRPVGDPLPVGQAAAAHDASLDRRERLRDEPRLADPGVADDGHQLAARLRLRALPRLADQRRARARARRTASA